MVLDILRRLISEKYNELVMRGTEREEKEKEKEKEKDRDGGGDRGEKGAGGDLKKSGILHTHSVRNVHTFSSSNSTGNIHGHTENHSNNSSAGSVVGGGSVAGQQQDDDEGESVCRDAMIVCLNMQRRLTELSAHLFTLARVAPMFDVHPQVCPSSFPRLPLWPSPSFPFSSVIVSRPYV